MCPHGQDYNEELLENIIEILHADDVAQFLQRDRVLERRLSRVVTKGRDMVGRPGMTWDRSPLRVNGTWRKVSC